nr:hypothetical protein [Sinorhizobium meliloti]
MLDIPALSMAARETPVGRSGERSTPETSHPSAESRASPSSPPRSVPMALTREVFPVSLAAHIAWFEPLPPSSRTMERYPVPATVSPGRGMRSQWM